MVIATTTLPDEDRPQLGNGVEDEVAVGRESAVSNNGSVRIQIRETGESTWDSNAAGFSEFLGAYDTISMEFVGREDAEEYEVRARTETDYRTGAWTSPVSIITEFPGATALEVASTTETSATIRWQDNADNESGTQIWLREELDPLIDSGFGDWELVETIDPTDGTGEVQYTVDGLSPNHDYELYVKPFTPYASAETSTVDATTAVQIPQQGWYVILEADDGDRATVPEAWIDQERPNIEPEESTVGRWSIDIAPDDRLRNWLRSEAFIYYGGELWMRGPYTRYRPHGGSSSAAAQLRGLDQLQHLKSGGLAFDVTSEPGYEAIQRFGDAELPDWVVDVTTPASTTIDEGLTVFDAVTQSDLENVFGTPGDNDPWAFDGDRIVPLQTCWTMEADDYSRESGTDLFFDPEYSGSGPDDEDGSARELEEIGDWIEFEFVPLYDIPEGAFKMQVRFVGFPGENTRKMTVTLDGNVIWDDAAYSQGGSIGWGNWISPNLTPPAIAGGESHTIRFEITDDYYDDAYHFDVVAPLDGRFNYTFDNDVTVASDGTNYLDGPGYYPRVDLLTTEFSQSYNITAADLDAVVERLQATNDGGTTWLPSGGSEQDTAAATADFADAGVYGSKVQGRVTLGAYGDRESTPANRYLPQELDEYHLSIDTNALRVIDDQTYTGSPFSILSDLTEDSGMTFVGDARKDTLALEAFAPGDKVVNPEWTVEDADPVDTTEGYFNSITVFGPEQDDGTRLSATATSQQEVDTVGLVEGPAEFRPDATTEAELVSIARTLLTEGIAKDTVTGTLEIAPRLVQPGYAYRVDEFERFDERDSPAYVLQRGSFDWGTMSLDFEGRSLVDAIQSIKTEVSTVKRAL